MDASGETLTLDQLLEAASAADGLTRIEYRDAIASQGEAGLDAIEGWLTDPRLRHFALVVVERTADLHADLKPRAIAMIRSVTGPADDAGFEDRVARALAKLGVKPPRASGSRPAPGPIPAGYKVAPPYRDAHHVVVDHVAESGTRWGDIYLFACRRFFSGGFVRSGGGLLDPAGLLVCDRCQAAVEAGR